MSYTPSKLIVYIVFKWILFVLLAGADEVFTSRFDDSLPSLEPITIESSTEPQEAQDEETEGDNFVSEFFQHRTANNNVTNLEPGPAFIDISRATRDSIDNSQESERARSANHEAQLVEVQMGSDDINISSTDRGSPDAHPSRLSLRARRPAAHPYRPCVIHGNEHRYRKGCPCQIKNTRQP